MSGYKLGNYPNLYDPVSGAFVGVVDAAGNETMVPTVSKGATGGSRLLAGGENAISAMGVNFERRISPSLPMHFFGNRIRRTLGVIRYRFPVTSMR